MLGAALVSAGISFLHAGAASAATALEWSPLPGCAKELAVHSGDIPWVLGCDSVGTIFYLGTTKTCANGLCLGTPQWKQPAPKGSAKFIALEMTGNVMLADSNGALRVGVWSSLDAPTWKRGGNLLGSWEKVPTRVAGGAAGCITSVAWTANIAEVWGIGCGSSLERGIWQLSPVWRTNVNQPWFIMPGSEYWAPIGVEEANAAHQVALFSSSTNTKVTQNPWVVAVGLVFAYDGTSFEYVPTPADGEVTYATDGHIVAGGSVYKWTGNVYGAAGGWTKIIGPTPSAPIRQIAHSGKFGTLMGPSHLYATDTAGRIYRADEVQIDNPR